MPDSLDKEDLKAYKDASLDVLSNFKDIEKSLKTQSRFLKMNGIHQELIKSIQEEELSTQQKLSAIEANIRARSNEIYTIHQRILQQRKQGLAIDVDDLLRIQKHRQQIQSISREYNRLHAERAKSYITDALGMAKLRESTSEYAKMWSKGGPILIGIVAAGSLFKYILGIFNEIDKAAADFRKSMGITRQFTAGIDKDARDIHFEFGAVGVIAKHVYESTIAMAAAFGTTLSSTKDLAVTISLMSQQLGISASTSADFLKTMSSVAGTTASAQENMLLFTAKLSEAAGTNLDDILKDIASATKSHYNFMSRSPLAIAKAAVEAKRMGTSLNDAAKTASQLIQFTTSIRDEMEASVLLGESINLQRARELSYRKDLKGLNEEILRIAKQSRFEELDPFQQQAVAQALGKSADEVGKMLQSDRELTRLRNSQDVSVRKQLAAYEDLVKATQDRAVAEAKSEKNIISIKNNSARIESIQQSWKAIIQRIAESFLPVIDSFLGSISDILSGINRGFGGWIKNIGIVLVGIGGIVAVFFGLSKFFSGIGGALGKGIGSFFTGTAGGVKQMGSPSVLRGVVNILALSASLIPFAIAMKMMNGVEWKTLFIAAAGLTALGIGAAILGPILPLIGAGAIAIAALGASLIPFSAAMFIASKAIQNFSGGFQNIVNGFKDLQNLSLSRTIIQVISLTSALKDLAVEMRSIPDIKFDKLREVSVGFNASVPQTVKAEKESDSDMILESIRDEICAMRKQLADGSISANVYLDSQLLSSQIDRITRFKNGYGVNSTRIA